MRFRNQFTEEFFGVDGTTHTVTRETTIVPDSTPTPVIPRLINLSDPTPSTQPIGGANDPREIPADASPNTTEPAVLIQPTINLLDTIRPPVVINVNTDEDPTIDLGGIGGGSGGGFGGSDEEERLEAPVIEENTNKKRNQIILLIILAIGSFLAYKYFSKRIKA